MGTHPIFESDFDCLTECPVPLQLPTSENPPREVEPHQVALQPSEIANHNPLPKRPPLPPLPTRDPVTWGNFTPKIAPESRWVQFPFGDVFDVHRFSFHPAHLGQIHPLLNDSSKKIRKKTHLTILLDKNSVKNMPLFHQWLLAAP